MYKVIINWYGNICNIDQGSDFKVELHHKFPIENKSQEDVENIVYDVLDNVSYNHYGLFSQQTEVEHKIIY